MNTCIKLKLGLRYYLYMNLDLPVPSQGMVLVNLVCTLSKISITRQVNAEDLCI